MFTGNPHQDRRGHKSFTSGWKSGWDDRKSVPAIPTPKATWQKPAPWQNDAPWKSKGPLTEGGRFVNPDAFSSPKQFVNPPAEKFWNDGTPLNNPNMTQLLGDQANYSTKDRIYDDWMVDDYLNQGIIMPDEVYDYSPGYKQVRPKLMGQELVGNMTAMAGKKTGKRPPLAMVPGNVVAPNVPEHTGFSDDLFKQDPHRTYNHGYRYNNYGLKPLYFG